MLRTLAIVAFLTAILLSPVECYGHELNPAYYPLGPFGLVITITSVIGIIPILLVVGLCAVILHEYVARKSLAGSLWRAATTLVASKGAESVPGVMILSTAPSLAWSSDSFNATVLLPAFLFGVGVAVNALLIRVLYRRDAITQGRVWLASAVLGATSYVILLLSVIAMLETGWMR